jgi:murein DD-endopeptidase MepM/ murein hydrolase activator NlpD
VIALASMVAGCTAGGGQARVPVVKPAVPQSPVIVQGTDFVLIGTARQGGVMRGTAPMGTRSLEFNGVSIPIDKDRQFLIGLDRDSSSRAVLRATMANGQVIERVLTVQPTVWRIEQVDTSPTANIPSAEFVARRKAELARIAAARAVAVTSDGWRQSFRWPVEGRISGRFGSQRIYRGEPGSYHSGVDVAVPAGTPFVAPADGVVVLAAQRPFTLEGYLLIVDHGMGLNSAFLHCSSLWVKEGDVVKQGQALGTVGATGRATGAHMHWGMKWRDARIDPMPFAGAMK